MKIVDQLVNAEIDVDDGQNRWVDIGMAVEGAEPELIEDLGEYDEVTFTKKVAEIAQVNEGRKRIHLASKAINEKFTMNVRMIV